jgi:hypothetical protein
MLKVRSPSANSPNNFESPSEAEVLNPDIKLHISGDTSMDKCVWEEIIAPVNDGTPTTEF